MRRRAIRKEELTEAQKALLLHGEGEFLLTDKQLQAMWTTHGTWATREFSKLYPGRRPKLWWKFKAPRWQVEDMPERIRSPRLSRPEPRKRLGGAGTPAHEVLNVIPALYFGLPTMWVEALDPADPPRYESQATYLDRHGLLFAEERRRLTEADFAPEVIQIPPATSRPAPKARRKETAQALRIIGGMDRE